MPKLMTKLVGELAPKIPPHVHDDPGESAAMIVEPYVCEARGAIFYSKPTRLPIREQPDPGEARLAHSRNDGDRGAGQLLPPITQNFQGCVEERDGQGLRLPEGLSSSE